MSVPTVRLRFFVLGMGITPNDLYISYIGWVGIAESRQAVLRLKNSASGTLPIAYFGVIRPLPVPITTSFMNETPVLT